MSVYTTRSEDARSAVLTTAGTEMPGRASLAKPTTAVRPGYRLAAAGREAAEHDRLGLLEQLYDPASHRRRALVKPGWRCPEVGEGRGSMAAWLAEQVGPDGHALATDINAQVSGVVSPLMFDDNGRLKPRPILGV
jgi:hypothetical protein